MREENEGEPQEAFRNRESAQALDGKVIQVHGSTLMMTNHDGKTLFYTLATDAKFTWNGQVCQAADLKPGTKIRVMTDKRRNMATSVEALETGSSTPK